MPGFRLSLGVTLFYLGLVVLLPLSALALKTSGLRWTELVETLSSSRALAAFRLSFGGAFIAATLNTFVGFILSWILVRYRFPGRAFVDALIDLPLALPTAVAGIALTAVYAPNGILGQYLDHLGLQLAFTKAGVILAMVFVGLPFTVRSIQPVLMEFDPQIEEAAAVLGASKLRTFFIVILPSLLPAAVTGFALAFARAVGEYGSIVFISGNMPLETEIVPLLIVTKLEQFQYSHATALAMVMLIGSLLTLLTLNFLQAWNRNRTHHD